MWASELDNADRDSFDTKHACYSNIKAYWAVQKTSVAGMLGDHTDLHTRYFNTSRCFLSILSQSHPIEHRRALGIGPGVGRFTRYPLSDELDTVDILG